MTHEGNYKDYRRTLRTCDPPAVPYLGIYLTDLTFIEEGNSDMDGNLINFDKRYKIAAILSEIQQFQKSGYSSFTEDTTIQYWLRHLPSVSEEEAYSISLKVEPRDLDEAVEKLLIDEDKLRQEVKILQLRNADLEVFIFRSPLSLFSIQSSYFPFLLFFFSFPFFRPLLRS